MTASIFVTVLTWIFWSLLVADLVLLAAIVFKFLADDVLGRRGK